MKITLVAGRAHEKHTEGGDFRQATYRAVRQGLRTAESVLLEPWYDYRLDVPAENVGRAMTDLQRMAGECGQPETVGDRAILTGSAPVAALRGYSTEVTAYTHGRGRLSCRLKGYAPCTDPESVIAAIGYDCDADVENTADSVFCSHGAGTVVKWDEVPSCAHVDSGLRLGSEPEPDAPTPARRAEDYCRMLATDEELLRIFERTYGPVRRRLTALEPTKKTAAREKPYRAKPVPQGPEYLLVDGYNVIFAWDELSALARHDLESARIKLADILCNYQGFHQCELILVFDAYKVKGNPGSVEQYHNITIVYTREAETADQYIERVTHELNGKRRVRVATSDGMEQVIILGHGALRVSARAFHAEVMQAVREIEKLIERQ
jgi:predicted RNA-binding protein with PIN domain